EGGARAAEERGRPPGLRPPRRLQGRCGEPPPGRRLADRGEPRPRPGTEGERPEPRPPAASRRRGRQAPSPTPAAPDQLPAPPQAQARPDQEAPAPPRPRGPRAPGDRLDLLRDDDGDHPGPASAGEQE